MKNNLEKNKIITIKNLSIILILFCLIMLIAGTVVLMAGGAVKCIEDVRVGDKVKSYNPATGKVSEKRVCRPLRMRWTNL